MSKVCTALKKTEKHEKKKKRKVVLTHTPKTQLNFNAMTSPAPPRPGQRCSRASTKSTIKCLSGDTEKNHENSPSEE